MLDAMIRVLWIFIGLLFVSLIILIACTWETSSVLIQLILGV